MVSVWPGRKWWWSWPVATIGDSTLVLDRVNVAAVVVAVEVVTRSGMIAKGAMALVVVVAGDDLVVVVVADPIEPNGH